MRIVVFSDSHNNYFALKAVVSKEPSAEVFLHLGDGEKEFEYLQANYPDKLMRGVRGNCDWGSAGKAFDTITCETKKIFFTHGHLYGVKAHLDDFKNEVQTAAAHIGLFGHTHLAYTEYENGIYYMNPGSVASPKYDKPSYGVIDITPAGIVTNIVYL